MARKSKSYSIIMPRAKTAGAGAVFSDGSFVVREGKTPENIATAMLQGGSIGVHATDADNPTHSLCKCPLDQSKLPAKLQPDNLVRGKARFDAAQHVTCKFCLTRLVRVGFVTADTLSPKASAESRAYALDYGTRDPESEIAAIATRKAEALAALAPAPEAAPADAPEAPEAPAATGEGVSA